MDDLHDRFDVSDEREHARIVADYRWLRRQARALLDQRRRAYKLGRRDALEQVRDLCREVARGE